MKYKIAEIICVAAAALFIFFTLSLNAETDKTAEEIGSEITEQIDVSDLLERDSQFFKKTFDRTADEFDGIVYYSSDNVMNVSEMLVIRLKDSSDSDITDTLEKYINSRYDTYAAYAPDQGDMLKNRVLTKKGNVVFMYVGKNPDAASDAFNSSF